MKKKIHDFFEMKNKREPITFITSYDYPTATFVEKAGIDMILVGDSLGMCIYGYDGTMPVTMDQMIAHSDAVRRGAPNTFVIGDMPFLSYQPSDQVAVENAGRFFKEAGVDAIKLEGGVRVASRIRAIVEAGMLVMGHIGLTPQSSSQLGGFKAQGRTLESAKAQIDDALAVQEAGAAMILLEAIPPEVSGYIRKTLSIPVLSIGAGLDCDGQLLIVSDALGIFEAFTPKFVKRYAEVAKVSTEALSAYCKDVKSGAFPETKHTYGMIPEERVKFEKWAKSKRS
ncbi:MAG: 3-methyl-2-oxobutanoate hydroxymethyltransferase [Deltaproteobacteria bacterium HGW-Deltaproteobacteria-15]|jgi:3-methyl-2-oxobutanoate hydroxymethyltransferase|nr:MAG: 3-methyl-2-oxobutanoate hydroxymethyltransferase [Deltaproteobacteria bacterium HGW-Deltaproteobacteria-15]